MPEPGELKLPCKQVDEPTQLQEDVSKMLQRFVRHEAAFSRFAARQELLLSKIVETLDVHVPVHAATVIAADENSQTWMPAMTNESTKAAAASSDSMESRPPKQSWKYRKACSWDMAHNGSQGCDPKRSSIRNFVESPKFDLAMAVVVFLHMCVMWSQLQWKANEISKNFDRPRRLEDPFVYVVIDKAFNGVYLAELCVRLCVVGFRYFRQSPVVHSADTSVVIICCLVSLVLDPLKITTGGGEMIALARVIRIARICRVLRAFKIFKYLNVFTELRIMIQSLQTAFSRTLFWAVIILGFIMFVAALLMTTLCLPYIEDAETSISQRRWLHEYYGNPSRSIFTMFESTFTGRWGIPARPLVLNINPFFSLFYACYVIGISFATLKVMSSIFLKQTLDQAQVDSERKAFQMMKEKQTRSKDLLEIYRLADSDGDGKLDPQELFAMMDNQRVLEILHQLEISTDEMFALASILTDDETGLDFEEFLQCALKLKSSAQVVDVIQMMHAQQMAMKRLDEIAGMIEADKGKVTQVILQAPRTSLKQTLARAQSPQTPNGPRSPR